MVTQPSRALVGIGVAILNVAIFAALFVGGWAISPIAGMTAFTVGGMIVAAWTKSVGLALGPASLCSAAAVLWLAWGQLAVDNAPVHTPLTDAVRMLFQWPGPAFLSLGVLTGAGLSLAGWMVARPLATRAWR